MVWQSGCGTQAPDFAWAIERMNELDGVLHLSPQPSQPVASTDSPISGDRIPGEWVMEWLQTDVTTFSSDHNGSRDSDSSTTAMFVRNPSAPVTSVHRQGCLVHTMLTGSQYLLSPPQMKDYVVGRP
jgi:hypothetical protein